MIALVNPKVRWQRQGALTGRAIPSFLIDLETSSDSMGKDALDNGYAKGMTGVAVVGS